jgi:hypothetical protein
LIPHNPLNLCDAYWKAKELEKGILVKKSLLTSSSPYAKTTPSYPQPYQNRALNPSQTIPSTKPNPQPPPNPTPQAKKYPYDLESKENVGDVRNRGL